MKYKIDFEPNQLQFVVDLLSTTPLPYKDVAPLIRSIQQQVSEQNKVAETAQEGE